jgi:hypothetical protein
MLSHSRRRGTNPAPYSSQQSASRRGRRVGREWAEGCGHLDAAAITGEPGHRRPSRLGAADPRWRWLELCRAGLSGWSSRRGCNGCLQNRRQRPRKVRVLSGPWYAHLRPRPASSALASFDDYEGRAAKSLTPSTTNDPTRRIRPPRPSPSFCALTASPALCDRTDAEALRAAMHPLLRRR